MEHVQLKRLNSSDGNSVINSSRPGDWAMLLHPMLSTSAPGTRAPGGTSAAANPHQAVAPLRMESQAKAAEVEKKQG